MHSAFLQISLLISLLSTIYGTFYNDEIKPEFEKSRLKQVFTLLIWAAYNVLLFVTLFMWVHTGFSSENIEFKELFYVLTFTLIYDIGTLFLLQYKKSKRTFAFIQNLISLDLTDLVKYYLRPDIKDITLGDNP